MPNYSTTSTTISKKISPVEDNGRNASVGKPTPLDFGAFLPWICLQWEVPEQIVVTRLYQEKNRRNERRSSSTRSRSGKSMKIKESGELESDNTKTLNTEINTAIPSVKKNESIEHKSLTGDIVNVKAIYDARGYLVEVAIVNCPVTIHRKLIQAINICVPFHAFFTKLVIRGNDLSVITLHEISKLLPHSNLTHVCLDDTSVPESNYYELLDHTSQLKCLSLNRCRINDTVCKEIAERIDFDRPAYSTLMVLELSSNLITDLGAKCFGDMLKMNRRLLHLNLTGNKITDVGAKAILKHLMEFEVSSKEIRQSASRNLNYTEKRKLVLKKCIDDVINRNREVVSSKISVKRSKNTKFKNQSSVSMIDNQSILELAEAMTKEIMGVFEDPFESNNIVTRNQKYFSTGNMMLCSLNLSYNDLGYASVRIIAEVLEYQSEIEKPDRGTGLLRIVIDGNPIPDSCAEYKTIETCLNKTVHDKLPINRSHRRCSSSLTKKNL